MLFRSVIAEGPDAKLLLSSKCPLCAAVCWECFQQPGLFPAYAKSWSPLLSFVVFFFFPITFPSSVPFLVPTTERVPVKEGMVLQQKKYVPKLNSIADTLQVGSPPGTHVFKGRASWTQLYLHLSKAYS